MTMRDKPHDRLDFDHLNFAECCNLVATFDAALKALSHGSDQEALDNMALLHGRALMRQADALRELERERANQTSEPPGDRS